jgi:ketosteroid isomerase-like protein
VLLASSGTPKGESNVSDAIETVKRYAAAATASMPEDGSGASAQERLANLLDMLDPEIRITVAASLPYGGEYVGHDGFLALGERFGKTWQVLDNGAGGYADLGDGRVVGFYKPTFRSVATGRTVSFGVVEILTVKDGRIAELTPYYSDSAVLVAAVTP